MSAAASSVAGAGGSLLPWRAMRAVLLSAWQMRLLSVWDALWLPVLGVVIFATDPGADARKNALMAASIIMAGALWMALFLFQLALSVVAQNHPDLANTVPGQVRALRWVLGLAVVLPSSLSAMVAAALNGPVAGVACSVAGAFTLIACGARWPRLWIALLTVPLWWASDGATWVLDGIRSLPWPVLVMIVSLAVVWALRAVVMTGGERHAQHHLPVLRSDALKRGELPALPPVADAGKGMAWAGPSVWCRRAYAASLTRMVGRARRSPTAFLGVSQGPEWHWTAIFAGAAMIYIISALVGLAVSLPPYWASDEFNAIRAAMSLSVADILPLTAAVLTALQSFEFPEAASRLMWARRREQALLRLLPGTPQGAALNHSLALHLSRCHLTRIVLMWLPVWGLAAMRAVPASDWAIQMSQAALLLSPLATLLLWRDWSSLMLPSLARGFLTLVLGICTWAGVGLMWFGWLGYSATGLAAVVLAVGLPLGLWRWRALQRAPVAWPVGRT